MKKTFFTLATLVLLLCVGAFAADTVLSNDDVVRMHQAGLSAGVVISAISGADQTNFDTSVDAIVEMGKLGVPSEVIEAMQNSRASASSVSTAPAQADRLVVAHAAGSAPSVPTNFAGTPCTELGIFAETEVGPFMIEPSAFSGSKSGGIGERFKNIFSYGFTSVKARAELMGVRSSNQVRGGSLTFLFCFEEQSSGLSHSTGGSTSPSEFMLVRMDMKENRSSRMLVTGKASSYSGFSGPPPKYREQFTHERIAPGVYRVTPYGLSPGEYAFMYAGSANAGFAAYYGLVVVSGGNVTGGKVFDFSVY